VSDPRGERAGQVVMRLVGGLLIAMGGLIAVTCGAITAEMWSTCATIPGQPGPFAFLGLVPAVLGVLMAVSGVILIIVARRKPAQSPEPFE
jgi:hypothetical protein